MAQQPRTYRFDDDPVFGASRQGGGGRKLPSGIRVETQEFSFEDDPVFGGRDEGVSAPEPEAGWGETVLRSAQNMGSRIVQSGAGVLQGFGEGRERSRQEILAALDTVIEGPPERGEDASWWERISGPIADIYRGGRARERLSDAVEEVTPEVGRLILQGLQSGDAEALSQARALLEDRRNDEIPAAERRVREFAAEQGAELHQDLEADIRANQPNVPERSFKWYVGKGIESVGSTMIPATVAGLATRNPNAGLAVMFPQVFGLEYGQARASGRDEREAFQDAVFAAVSETASERIPLGILTREGGGFLRRAITGGAAEGVQEAVNEAVQIGYDLGVLEEGLGPDEALWRLVDAGIIGAMGGTATAVATEPVRQLGRRRGARAPEGEPLDAEEVLGAAPTEGPAAGTETAPETGERPALTMDPIIVTPEGEAGTPAQRRARREVDRETGLTEDVRRAQTHHPGFGIDGYSFAQNDSQKSQSGPAPAPPSDTEVARTESERGLRRQIADLEAGVQRAESSTAREALRAELERLRRIEAERQPRLTPAERAREARRVDPGQDDLLTAIQKLGGIDTALETDWTGRFEGRGQRRPGLPALERPGRGRSLDDLAEPLHELGYLQRRDASELADKLAQAESGARVFSLAREQAAMEREALEAERARNLDEEPVAPGEMDPEVMTAWQEYADEGVPPGEVYAPEDYEPDADAQHRILTDVARLAQDMNPDEAERIIEDGARRGLSDEEVIRALLPIIREGRRDAAVTQAPEEDGESGAPAPDAEAPAAGAPGRPPAEAQPEPQPEPLELTPQNTPRPSTRPREEQADAFGGRTEAEQALFEAERERERREQDAPPPEEGEGELFSGGARQVDIDDAANQAATSPQSETPEPTEAQKQAGNYQKGHITLHGLDISIENPAGSRRRPEWPPLTHHYGYIRGTEGRDGDHVDAFLGPEAEAENPRVFVVDQINPETRRFDEHKVMFGFPSAEAAREGYLSNYEEGWQGLGNIREFTLPEFKLWLEQGDTTRRVTSRNERPRASTEGEKPEAPEGRGLHRLASRIADFFNDGNTARALDWRGLFRLADEAFGGTQAEGAYTSKEAYDALELGLNLHILSNPQRYAIKEAGDLTDPAKQIKETLRRLNGLIDRLPTQSRRSEEQQALQQFSTPHTHAALAAWVAKLRPSDAVLEPSAGTGNLITHAHNAGAGIIWANELAERRARALRALDVADAVFTENASHLNAVLPAHVRPSVVLMNPPFSADVNRAGKRDLRLGATHVEQALKRLPEGGRLVAIVGRGMAFGRPRMREWWDRIGGEYTVRANIGISGAEYRKFGTAFDNQLVVIDNTGPTADWAEVVNANVDTVIDAAPLLARVRNDRPDPAEQPADQPAGAPGAAATGAGGRSDGAVQRPADSVGPGERTQRPGGEGRGAAAAGGRGAAGDAGGRGDALPERERGRGDDAARGDAGGSEPAGDRPGADGGAAPQAGGAESDVSGTVEFEQAAPEQPDDTELSASTFENYRPSVSIKGAKPHPADLAESAAMASVRSPRIRYSPKLPEEVITSGRLSAVQLEAIAQAGQAHNQQLPNGARRGYFIGDGTGVGKGAQVAGIILDNWNRGRRKAVWVSENQKLFDDAQRDAEWVGLGKKRLLQQAKIKGEIRNAEGVLFTTYHTLRSASKETKDAQGRVVQPAERRLDQLINWLGEDFDGVIAFDESHNMRNALDQKAERGMKQASEVAKTAVELQQRLPNARIVYVSATGATEVENLAYAERLGLWGEGTAFPDKEDFITKIKAGGVAAMEVVAKDMKAMGLYTARSLSFEGIAYDTVEHRLSPPQVAVYNRLADAWQMVLRNVNEALRLNGAEGNGQARSRALSAFWGSHQRFFNQVITAMQVPSLIESVERELTKGHSAVLQLVNTNEAVQKRRLAQAATEDLPLDEVDVTPRDILMQYVANAYPTTLYEAYIDEDGNERTRPVTDSAGNPVENPEAVAQRDSLLEELGSLEVPEGVLEQLISHFGSEAVAEITGRSERLVRQPNGEIQRERLTESKKRADADAFMAGKKRILVFSDAGGTGRSYHADLRAKNQQPRIHYLVQPGWRADKAVQGFGRTHRTNQAQPPEYRLVTTDLKAQRRFLSSIARRLDQLGALTKGQREASSQGMFSADMNLENEYATAAVDSLIRDVMAGRVEGVPPAVIEQQMGLEVLDEDGNIVVTKIPSVPRFLNRLLSLRTEVMDGVFDAFFERLVANVEYARQQGVLDTGMETLTADSIVKDEEQSATVDEIGNEVRYVRLTLTHPVRKVPYERLPLEREGLVFARNRRSGRLYAFHPATAATDPRTGQTVERMRRIGPATADYVTRADFTTKYSRESGSDAQLRAAWQEDYDRAPDTRTEQKHLIVGALLPVWDRLPPDRPRIVRARTDEGERLLGREITAKDVDGVLERLGITASGPDLTPAQVIERVMGEGATVSLANGWRLTRRRVSGENRLEIVGPSAADIRLLKQQGAFTEIINYRTRVFVPLREAERLIGELIRSKPVTQVIGVEEDGTDYRVVDVREPTGGQRARRRAGAMMPDLFDPAVRAEYTPAPAPRPEPGEAPTTVWLSDPAGPPVERALVRVENVAVGRLPVGIERVRSAAEAAHVVAGLRRLPQEYMVAVVTGARGQLLGVVQHTVGLPDASQVSLSMVLGAVSAFPDARAIWTAHNHPSGLPQQSQADHAVADRLAEALRGTGIEYRGSIVVAPGGRRATVYAPTEGGSVTALDEREIEVLPAPRRHTTPTFERQFRRLNPRPSDTIGTPAEMRRVLGAQPGSGVLLLNNRHSPVGWVRLSPNEMGELRTGEAGRGATRLWRAIHEVNAVALAAKVDDAEPVAGDRLAETAVENLRGFAELLNLRFLDAYLGQGRMHSETLPTFSDPVRTFYRRRDPSEEAPDPQDFVLAPDGALDFGAIEGAVAQALGRAAGAIRLQRGEHNENTGRGFGLEHIAQGHGEELRRLGYESVPAAVADIARGYNRVYRGDRGRLRLVKTNGADRVLVVELRPDPQGGADVWSAVTAFPSRRVKGELLWDAAQSRPTGPGGQSAFARGPVTAGQATPNAERTAAGGTIADRLAASQGRPSRLPREAAEATAARLMQGWENRPSVIVVQSETELPQALQAQIARDQAEGEVKGAWHRGRVYVVADNARSHADVERTVLHEVVGHHGLRSLLGQDFVRLLDDVYLAYGDTGLADIAARYGFNLNDRNQRRAAAEEKLAHMAETGEHPSLLARLVALLTRWLRRMGFRLGLNRAEIADLVRRARQHVEGGRATVPIYSQGTAYQRVYHGSPHEFERFELQAIGTGEGNQAYGWGLYFASQREVAEWYRDQLSAARRVVVREPIGRRREYRSVHDYVSRGRPSFEDMEAVRAAREVDAFAIGPTDKESLLFAAESYEEMAKLDTDPEVRKNDRLLAKAMRDLASRLEPDPRPGRLYEVEIPEAEAFLDWDVPLKGQPETIRGKLEPAREWLAGMEREGGETALERWEEFFNADFWEWDGREIYRALELEDTETPLPGFEESLGSPAQNASRYLVSLGIPGVRYLDGASRRTGGESYNFVIFDDSLVSVEARYRLRDKDEGQQNDGFVRDIGRGQPIDRVFRSVFEALRVPQATAGTYNALERAVLEGRFKEDGRMAWLNPVLEQIRAGLIDRHGLPEDYIARDIDREGEERQIKLQGKEFVEALLNRGVSAQEAEVLQAILTGEEIATEDWRSLAEPIRRSIDELGQEAVSLGLITEEAYQRNRGTYLHRVYRKYEFEEDGSLSRWARQVFERRRKKIIGNELRGRGIDLKVPAGEIQRHLHEWWGQSRRAGRADASLIGQRVRVFDRLAPTGEGTEGMEGIGERQPRRRRVLERVYLPEGVEIPARLAAWEDRGTFEVRTVTGDRVTLWRDFTKAERERMGEILDARYTIAKTYQLLAHDIATARFYRDIAEHPEWTWNPATQGEPEGVVVQAHQSRFRTYANADWVQVPDTKIPGSHTRRYGALAGQYVRAEIWRDINELERMQHAGLWQKILTQWKLNKTARNPVVHMNNVMSNFLFMDMADIRLRDLKRGIAELYRGGAHYQDALAHGVFGHNIVDQELREGVLRPVMEEIAAQNTGGKRLLERKLGVLGKLTDQLVLWGRRADKAMVDAYGLEDEVFRMALYMNRLGHGDTPRDAAVFAREQFLNYDIRAPWVQAARRTVLPFIAYTYRAVPVIAKSLAERPWKLAKYFTVAYAANVLAYALAPGDEEEERKSLAEEVQGYTWIGTPRMVRMPWRDEHGNPVFLDTRRWIPAGDIFDLHQGSSAVPIPAWLQFGGPIQLAGEFLLNTQGFTGEPITDPLTDTPLERLQGTAGWAWRSWMPSAPWLPESWYWQKIERAMTGGRDYLGRPYDLPLALASSFGVKLQPQDVDWNMRRKALEIDRTARELKFELRELHDDRRRDLIGGEQYREEREAIQRKMRNLRQRAKELFQESQ